MQELGDPDLTVILTVDPAKQTSSLPPYIVTPCDLAEFYLRTAGDADPQTKVFDFGNGEYIHRIQHGVYLIPVLL